jgi:hypothetical protein
MGMHLAALKDGVHELSICICRNLESCTLLVQEPGKDSKQAREQEKGPKGNQEGEKNVPPHDQERREGTKSARYERGKCRSISPSSVRKLSGLT